MSVPDNIRLARRAAKASQEEMAGALGVHKNTVLRWEKGQLEPKASDVVKIGHYTQVSPDQLLDWCPSGDLVADNITHYHVAAPPFDQALLESALLRVLQVLQQRNLKLSPERTVAGVLSVYEAARAQGRAEVTEADVTPLVRLLLA